jgi:hypothetical protein
MSDAMKNPDIRWIQRFQNFKKAFQRLTDAAELAQQCPLSELEQQGLIKAFEFTHELPWTTKTCHPVTSYIARRPMEWTTGRHLPTNSAGEKIQQSPISDRPWPQITIHEALQNRRGRVATCPSKPRQSWKLYAALCPRRAAQVG